MSCGANSAMRSFRDIRLSGGQRPGFELQAGVILVLLLPTLLLLASNAIRAQVVPAGYHGKLRLSAGVLGSGDTFQYGSRTMVGIGGFVDGETTGHFGIEAEGRWVEFRQRANVHAESYSIGGRYHFVLGRFQPYVKSLVGFTNFNFPYNYAQVRFLTVTAGGGVDFRWTHRFSLRVADVEYQDWPGFTNGNMTSFNGSVGLKVHIF